MRVVSLVFVLAFLVFSSTALVGQVNRGIFAAGRRMDDWDSTRSKADRDNMQKEMAGKKPTKEQLANAARVKAETREDLEGLQQSYNDIVTKLGGGQIPDSTFVNEAASKVNKHSSRLKANIVFPKPEKEEASKPIEIAGDTRRQLRDLCTRIYEFLTNPMIENPNVLDVEAAAKARLTLDSIIVASEKLKSS